MNASRQETIEIVDENRFGLHVQFQRLSDRWAHQIFWLKPNAPPQIVLSSIEGNSSEQWPPSPPMQELSLQRENLTAAPVAMLLGRAGTAHWSASFEFDVRPVRLVVDVACRISQPPGFVGSRYRIADAPADTQRIQDRIELARYGNKMVIGRAENCQASRSIDDSHELTISPFPQKPPATLRWKYIIALEPVDQELSVDKKTGRE